MNLAQEAHRVVPHACEDLLTSFGPRLSKRAGADIAPLIAHPDRYVAGVVDFLGHTMRGSVMVLSTFDFFAASRPCVLHDGSLRPQSAGNWLRVRDWSMELSNQLLGRIKSRLCALGVVVEASLPRAVSGHPLRVTVRERRTEPHVYTGASGDVFMWFDAEVKESAVPGDSIERVTEGGFVAF
jgi:hypothetical protein